MPVRIEIGPRDLAEGVVTLARRDVRSKDTAPVAGIAGAIGTLLARDPEGLLAEATAFRDARIADVASIDEAIEAGSTGFARIPWELVGDDGEDRLAEHAMTVRCLQTADGAVPEGTDDGPLRAIVARSY